MLTSLINNSALKGDYARTLLKSPATLKREFETNGFAAENSEMFVIVDQSNTIVGTIGHFITAHYSSARELGFSVFSQENHNKGIASEAVCLLRDYLFGNFPINRLQISMPTGHKSCEQVAIKCGFNKEGVLRGTIFVGGEYLDTNMYSLLRSEFQNRF